MLLDLTAVRRAPWNPTPYPWAAVPSPLHAGHLETLVEHFPLCDFALDKSTPNHERLQQTRTLAVGSGGRLLHRERALPQVWDALLDDLVAPDYREEVGAGAGLDLRDAGLAVAIWRMPPGGFNAVHNTSPAKMVSQLIYFSPDWDDECGGHFEVRSGEQGRDIAFSIPPRPGSSVMFRATPLSWHAVAPVSRSERRSLSIHYFHPEADLSWFLPRS